MERDARQEVKVGIFVIFFMVVIGLSAFVLGGSSEMFEPTYTLHTTYKDVKGLKAGAIVRVAGIDVGEVSAVEFFDPATHGPALGATDAAHPDAEAAKNEKDREIYVELKIQQRYQPRIRGDSTATISSVGLLGDMYVTITAGGVDAPILNDATYINSAEALDMMSYADTATSIVEKASSISGKVDLMLGSEEEASKAQIGRSLSHVEALLADARNGKGLLHLLIYDQTSANMVKESLANLQVITANFRDVSNQLKSGDGVASALIYGDNGDELITQLAQVAGAIDGLLADLESEESLAHALIYDPERAQIVADLQETANSLKTIAAAVENGEGTAGLLVRDPQLYEDMRALLGGAQRNALLRAYIRSTMAKSRDENASGWDAPAP